MSSLALATTRGSCASSRTGWWRCRCSRCPVARAGRGIRHRRDRAAAIPRAARSVLARGGLPPGAAPRSRGVMRPPVPAALPVVLAALALVSGCAVGPNFRGPAPPTVEGYARPSLAPATAAVDIAGGEQQRLAPEGDVPHDWWTLFRSPGLTRLVDQALRASPTLVASQQALRQAMELVAAQRGAFFPTVQGSFSPSYQQVS